MYIIYLCIRVLLYPFLRFILPLFSTNAKKRIEFELKNYISVSSLQRAEYGFEVSSEGELEQIKAVLLDLIANDHRVEIIYCSESVEKQCQKLLSDYPDHVRVYRLPVLTYFPLRKAQNINYWMTCQTFYMCRYDLFPELIHYGNKKAKQFILLSAVMKNFKQKSFLAKLYLKSVYKKFHKIVSVTPVDDKEFRVVLGHTDIQFEVFDFRTIQISQRIKNRKLAFRKFIPHYDRFNQFLNEYDYNDRLIFGSFWPFESDLISSDIPAGKLICIAPHNLDNDSLSDLKKNLTSSGISVYELSRETTEENFEEMISSYRRSGGVVILNIKGVLCELYSEFAYAYVGGGFSKSVHSLLEPYMGGSFVYCGPRTFKSTEYDLILSFNPERISVINEMDNFLTMVFSENRSKINSLTDFNDHFIDGFDSILEWLYKN